ncbi:ImmA/IrrE family metallo-endopeptidase [Arthrobacter rhombi]|uniref:ImmA/IrrE family metallo-endopeptidase n=1 Tax=Arthrobacter rhombi TaxID=71253 RepID=UPI003FD304E5
MFHPWGELRRLTHIIVIWKRPAPEVPAATDGERRIWIDPGLSQRERRCTLTHELVHLGARHRGCQPAGVERRVRAVAARELVTWEQLLMEVPWARSLSELADELWVTEDVLADRLGSLSPGDLEHLESLRSAAQG